MTTVPPAKTKNVISSTDAQQGFGRLLLAARRKPITIRKNDRDVVVMLSVEDYGNLVAGREDAYWAGRAEKAAKGGFLTEQTSEKYLKSLLHARR